MSLTDKAIARIRELIQSGELAPGAKLPPEPQLAMQLGLSRNLMREAVKVLEAASPVKIEQTRYDLGLGNIVELSTAQLNYTSAQIADTNAKYDYQLQRLVVDYQVGALR